MTWFHLGSNLKSIAELDSLVEDVLLKPDYDPVHLENFSAARENQRLDETVDPQSAPDGWTKASVKIKLPGHKVCVPEQDAPEFEVDGLLYRPLLDVMVEAFQSPSFQQFHTTPFEYRWDLNYNPNDPDIPVDPYSHPQPLDDDGFPPLPEHHEVINFFSMFVPDLLHKVELGSWKSLCTHLIRILYAYSPISQQKLDER